MICQRGTSSIAERRPDAIRARSREAPRGRQWRREPGLLVGVRLRGARAGRCGGARPHAPGDHGRPRRELQRRARHGQGRQVWLHQRPREHGHGLAEELGGEGVDAVELVLEPRVLDAQVLLLEGHLPEHGGAPAAAAHRAVHGLPDRHVLGAQLVVLLLEQRVLVPLQLRLGKRNHGTRNRVRIQERLK